MNLLILYWSQTGNTEKMAQIIKEECESKGSKVEMVFSDDYKNYDIDNFAVIAFGCPAMGDEELEDTSFEPMFSDLENKLSDKKIALFGSYEWNNGEWMGFWKERCSKNNLNVIDTVICYDTPDENSTADIKKFADNLLK